MVCAPMTFLNNNTTGRILNRFTKDMVVMDQTRPDVAYGDRLWRPSPCPLDYFPLYCGLCGKLLFFGPILALLVISFGLFMNIFWPGINR